VKRLISNTGAFIIRAGLWAVSQVTTSENTEQRSGTTERAGPSAHEADQAPQRSGADEKSIRDVDPGSHLQAAASTFPFVKAWKRGWRDMKKREYNDGRRARPGWIGISSYFTIQPFWPHQKAPRRCSNSLDWFPCQRPGTKPTNFRGRVWASSWRGPAPTPATAPPNGT
jgi:hypothetical protein